MIVKRAGAPGVTVIELLCPVFLEPDVEIVTPEAALVIVTWPVHEPAEKALVLFGLMVPVESLRVLDLV